MRLFKRRVEERLDDNSQKLDQVRLETRAVARKVDALAQGVADALGVEAELLLAEPDDDVGKRRRRKEAS